MSSSNSSPSLMVTCTPYYNRQTIKLGLRAVQLTLIMAVVITTGVLTMYSDLPRDWVMDNYVDPYTSQFQLEWPTDYHNAEIWDESLEFDTPIYLETHSHTNHSDGSLTPSQLVDWAQAYGLTAICVTDHNNIEGGWAARNYSETLRSKGRPAPLVIPGVEFTCCRIHMNFLGIEETIKPTENWPSDEELKSVIKKVHALGGVVIVNHLPWSESTEWGRKVPTLMHHPTPDQLLSWGVDSFECVSDGVMDLQAVRYAERNNLVCVTATDIHNPSDTVRAVTVLDGPLTQKNIINKLKRKSVRSKSTFYYDPIGPTGAQIVPPYNNKRNKWAPLAMLNFGYMWDESKGMYSFVDGFCHERKFTFRYGAAFWTLFWIVLGWVLYELTRAIVVGIAGSNSCRRRRPLQLD